MLISSFRKDIQSLRGLAIFLVLIFHFYPKALPSGYLGVDLFFVISGYLITVIFFKFKEKSFFYFFLKRLHRLGPSIIFIIFFTSIVVSNLFLVADIEKFWLSVISTLFFLPNLYFLLDGGYFGGEAHLKPLLHIWSLGLEIQFYFFFSLLLYFVKKTQNKNFFKYIFIIFILSFIIYVIFNYYGLDRLSFFLLPTRLWQFCLGSLIFFLPLINKKWILNYLFYFISLILICFICILNASNNIVLKQIFITLFGAIIIYSGIHIKKDFFLINNIFFQFLGKISYSLYIVHWPVLVIANYYYVRDIFFEEKLILILITLLISYFFYILIENNFRYKITKAQSIKYLLLVLFFIIIVFLFTFSKKNSDQYNFAQILNSSRNSHYRCDYISYLNFKKNIKCKIIKNKTQSDIEAVLYGNSHAQMYGYTYEKLLEKKKINGLILPMQKCLPTTTVNINLHCLNLARYNVSTILSNKTIKYVFIGLDWEHEKLIDDKKNQINNFDNLVLSQHIYELIQIFELNNKITFLIGPISSPDYPFSSIESRNIKFKNTSPIFNHKENLFYFERRFFEVFNFFDSIKNYSYFIKPHLIQCSNGPCIFSKNYNGLFSDSTHLSKFGSNMMNTIFYSAFDDAIKKKNNLYFD
jgi:peptidoglycan/LPS O-acetylase OafA/YrhL